MPLTSPVVWCKGQAPLHRSAEARVSDHTARVPQATGHRDEDHDTSKWACGVTKNTFRRSAQQRITTSGSPGLTRPIFMGGPAPVTPVGWAKKGCLCRHARCPAVTRKPQRRMPTRRTQTMDSLFFLIVDLQKLRCLRFWRHCSRNSSAKENLAESPRAAKALLYKRPDLPKTVSRQENVNEWCGGNAISWTSRLWNTDLGVS